MRTLKLYEVGVDPLPVDDSYILVFDKHNSFNMFDKYYANEGTVEYMYGDIANSLKKAIELGGFISTSPEEIRKYEGDDKSKLITVDVSSGQRLITGTLWMYSHEYYPVIEKDLFPFQTWREYNVALKQGWIELIKFVEDTRPIIVENSESPIHYDKSLVLVSEIPIYYDKSLVKFNGKKYKLEWCRIGTKEISLLHWDMYK